MFDKKKYFFIFILPFLLIFSACAPGASGSGTGAALEGTPTPENMPTLQPTPTFSILELHYVPPYYSLFYGDIISASKTENGLLVYSPINAASWEPAIRAFQEHFPWVNVLPLEVAAGEAFARYTAEYGTNVRTADIIVSPDVVAWQEFIAQGQVLTYRSPEEAYLPSWARSGSGIYALSGEPLLIVYNKQLVVTQPETMEQVGILASAFENEYRDKISTLDITSPDGFAANWFWLENEGEPGWNVLNAVGKTSPTLTVADNRLLQAVASGDIRIAYFVPSQLLLSRLEEFPELGWSYIKDGQPILLYNMAITQANASPNSAKLFLDFLLSQEGQVALAMGGLTPYRSDITRVSQLHLETVSQQVGQENLIFSDLAPELQDAALVQPVLERWLQAMKADPEIPAPVDTATP